jgi:hypothetical protein
MAQKVSQRAPRLPSESLINDGVKVDDALFDGNECRPGGHWFAE